MFESGNFPSTTETEKAFLWRECMNVGLGQITPEVFYTVMNDCGIMVKFIRIKMNTEIPNYIKELDSYHPNSQNSHLLKLMNQHLFLDPRNQETIR